MSFLRKSSLGSPLFLKNPCSVCKGWRRGVYRKMQNTVVNCVPGSMTSLWHTQSKSPLPQSYKEGIIFPILLMKKLRLSNLHTWLKCGKSQYLNAGPTWKTRLQQHIALSRRGRGWGGLQGMENEIYFCICGGWGGCGEMRSYSGPGKSGFPAWCCFKQFAWPQTSHCTFPSSGFQVSLSYRWTLKSKIWKNY